MFPSQATQTQSSPCRSRQQARLDSSLGIWSRYKQHLPRSWKTLMLLCPQCSSTLATTFSSGTPGHDESITTVDQVKLKSVDVQRGKVEERANIRGCSTGRQTETGQDLHVGAHRHLGLRAYCCCSLCPCPGGQPWAHVEGHAGGFNIRNVPPKDPLVIE